MTLPPLGRLSVRCSPRCDAPGSASSAAGLSRRAASGRRVPSRDMAPDEKWTRDFYEAVGRVTIAAGEVGLALAYLISVLTRTPEIAETLLGKRIDQLATMCREQLARTDAPWISDTARQSIRRLLGVEARLRDSRNRITHGVLATTLPAPQGAEWWTPHKTVSRLGPLAPEDVRALAGDFAELSAQIHQQAWMLFDDWSGTDHGKRLGCAGLADRRPHGPTTKELRRATQTR